MPEKLAHSQLESQKQPLCTKVTSETTKGKQIVAKIWSWFETRFLSTEIAIK